MSAMPQIQYSSIVERILAARGIDAAYREACRALKEIASQMDTLNNTRFFECRTFQDCSKKLLPTTERQISNTLDDRGLGSESFLEYFYCDLDGKLYPILIGEPTRNAAVSSDLDGFPFAYASADMVANGKVVGHVDYTDH